MLSTGQISLTIPVPPERRRFRRVTLSVRGRYMLEDMREFPCQTLDLSPVGVVLSGPVIGEVGSRVIAYLEHIGRVEGFVVRKLGGAFALSIVAPQRKHAKLASQLAGLDCSSSGAALDCSETIPLGTVILIGRRKARVVRHYTSGIAVAFDQPINSERFGLNFEL
jgi:hypothetical protein